jgi:hypothetical protein
MSESREKSVGKPEWQLTTTTILCPAVKRRVCLMVKGDWESYCCWRKEQEKGHSGRLDACKGPECTFLVAYKDALVREELESRF